MTAKDYVFREVIKCNIYDILGKYVNDIHCKQLIDISVARRLSGKDLTNFFDYLSSYLIQKSISFKVFMFISGMIKSFSF